MAIDTGLPAAPEGYYWEIRHPHDAGYFSIGYVPDKTQIMIQLVAVKKTKTVQAKIPGPWYWPFDKTVNREVNICTEPGPYRLLGNKPTKGSILEAAEDILTEFEDRKKMLSYIGTYPPKKLEEN